MKGVGTKLVVTLLVMLILTSCVKPSNESAYSNVTDKEAKEIQLTKQEQESKELIREKSKIYSTLSFEEKKEYYNIIFELFKSPNHGLRTEMFTCVWAILRYIEDTDYDIINFLLDKALSDEGIFYNIGSENTNDVLVRSYSLKVLASLVLRSTSLETINDEELIMIKDKLIEYIGLEKDRRGYIKGIGDGYSFDNWTMAIGSIIDVLKPNEDVKRELTNVIKEQLLSPYTSLNSGEDVRLANVLTKLTVNATNTDEMELFLRELKDELDDIRKSDKENYVYISSNVLIFLKTLYYNIDVLIAANKEPIKDVINNCIASIKNK